MITFLIWLLELICFCYYTVVDRNCIQADVKLSATHTISYPYMCKHFLKVILFLLSYTDLYHYASGAFGVTSI